MIDWMGLFSREKNKQFRNDEKKLMRFFLCENVIVVISGLFELEKSEIERNK